MTLDEAFSLAADWWIEQIARGRWDNGDPPSEAMHAMFASRLPGPTRDDMPMLREAIIEAHHKTLRGAPGRTQRYELYSDYGCRHIDDAAKARGLTFDSLLHGPQKTGTHITLDADGHVVSVTAKAGYGGVWAPLMQTRPAVAAAEEDES